MLNFCLWCGEPVWRGPYQSFSAEGIVVTGVRSDSATTDSIVLTASYTSLGSTSAALYQWSLAGAVAATIGGWNLLTPVFAGQTVTSSTFYGPNTPLFDANIPSGEVRAVGSYKYTEGASGPSADHGMMYVGPVDGTGGTWTQLDATSLVAEGALLNTIAHSTMGQLVVGNYDTSLATGLAFIYNLQTETWTNLNPGGTASVTAYGIWQNSENSYTIAGGASDVNSGGLDYGYLLDYNALTAEFSNFTKFQFDNLPLTSIISHFNGITGTEDGFHLTGDFLSVESGLGAFFASIAVNAETGEFGPATWTDISLTDAEITSGNTVVGDAVFGIYVIDGVTTSYVATVPEPTTGALFFLAAALLYYRHGKTTKQKTSGDARL